jgi:hypothetical protein
VQFTADHQSYSREPNSFLLERQLSSLTTSLNQARVTVIDSRISPAQMPVIDLRGNTPPAAPFTPPPAQTTTTLEQQLPPPQPAPIPPPTTGGLPASLTPGIENDEE